MIEKPTNQSQPGQHDVAPDYINPTNYELADVMRTVGNREGLEELQKRTDRWSAEAEGGTGRRVMVDVVNGPEQPVPVSWSPKSPWMFAEIDPEAEASLADARTTRAAEARTEAYLALIEKGLSDTLPDSGEYDEE